jgi:predicted dehydrogenase/threonine dehydrogenase-like Zn-dependent dehydrogenase
MLQAIVKKGKVIKEEVPAPHVSEGNVLIKVINSCISVGTEVGKVERSGKSLIKTALEQPENVRQVIDMAKSRGLSKTVAKIKGVVDTGKLTGYSVAGIVIEVGAGINRFKVGDRVAASGADLANHAEYVSVPENLVMKMPLNLDFQSAATVTLGGIAMQGVRRADLRLGEFAVVLGVGLIGLLCIQMLRASGVHVAAVDLEESRLNKAKNLGAELTIKSDDENMVSQIENWSNGYGADAVIFTAATKSSAPLSQAFKACKKKGRVVLVGVSGMDINRSDIYAKELDFLISTSYGPGRYDHRYEEKGFDYPYAYVRWTENRNMTEYLHLIAQDKIDVKSMIDKVYPLDQLEAAFDSLNSPDKPILVLLEYDGFEESEIEKYVNHERRLYINSSPINKTSINIGLIGAGNFATGTHLPNLKKLKDKYRLYAVANRSGYKAKAVGEQYGASLVTTNPEDIITDKNVDLILIATRHDSHARLTLSALQNKKHVFVEKPLATTADDLDKIEQFYAKAKESKPLLMVGFNRRFSPYALEIKKHTDKRINPLFIHYRMNAGYLPADHWTHENGGRIVGEGCHIIDLMTYFINAKIKSISYEQMTPTGEKFKSSDNISLVLKYDDGSVATIEYFACGNKKFPKEYMEVHFDEKSIIMDDYKSLKGYGLKLKSLNTNISEKGQLEELKHLYHSLSESDGKWPIEFWDLIQTTKITLSIR